MTKCTVELVVHPMKIVEIHGGELDTCGYKIKINK